MSHDASTPRLVYRGKTNDAAETATATDPDDLAAKLKAGYRLQRNPKPAAAAKDVDEPKAAAAPAADAPPAAPTPRGRAKAKK
jgi:hypothetical protein